MLPWITYKYKYIDMKPTQQEQNLNIQGDEENSIEAGKNSFQKGSLANVETLTVSQKRGRKIFTSASVVGMFGFFAFSLLTIPNPDDMISGDLTKDILNEIEQCITNQQKENLSKEDSEKICKEIVTGPKK